mgnify:CR=1 FL=1
MLPGADANRPSADGSIDTKIDIGHKSVDLQLEKMAEVYGKDALDKLSPAEFY